MKCSEMIDGVDGLRYVIDSLELSGGRVLRTLLSQPLYTQEEACEREWALVQAARELVENGSNRVSLDRLLHLFYQVQEIGNLLQSIGSKTVCNDVELFQIKSFALIIKEISDLLHTLPFTQIELPSPAAVFDLLDPDRTGVASFYVYSTYSPALESARKRGVPQEVEQEEDKVRARLMSCLAPYKELLLEAYREVAQVELVFAKAALAVKWGLCRPEVGDVLQIKGMFHPQIAARLETEGHSFQRVDICLKDGPCLLTGANMSGKTVVLKTVALVQVLSRLGFFVPATEARVPVTETLYLLVGDRQDSGRGLSSFAAEMLALNRVFATAEAGHPRLLVLVDEPARTTNPKEGRALLCALTAFFEKYRVRALISTHYSNLPLSCRRLRVAGFDAERVKGTLDPKKINEYMDYTVMEDTEGTVPMEALRIARLLEVNGEFLSLAGDYLNNLNSNE